MTSPTDQPDLVAQDVAPFGRWEPAGSVMTWVPATDYTGSPRGPLLDQVHETGRWAAGPGQFMTWVPAPAR